MVDVGRPPFGLVQYIGLVYLAVGPPSTVKWFKKEKPPGACGAPGSSRNCWLGVTAFT